MPAQAASATSGPQIIASQPIPVDITTTKALTIEIAKVPDGKPFDPHWTTYVQAIGTPIVAVIAAAIAATIQYRQWQTATAAATTAKNKLKLDLFDKRFAMFEAARELLKVCSRSMPIKADELQPYATQLRGVEFLFDDVVHRFIDELLTRINDAIQLQLERNTTLMDEPDNKEAIVQANEAIRVSRQWFRDNRDALKEHMAPFLQLSHEVEDAQAKQS